MSLLAELKQALYDLPLTQEPGRDKIAHFCEHNGIRRSFTRARTTWQALAPSAIKPWWMILEPLKRQHDKQTIKTALTQIIKIQIQRYSTMLNWDDPLSKFSSAPAKMPLQQQEHHTSACR